MSAAELWIRMYPDPDTDPETAFQVNPDPIRIQGFYDQKPKKKNRAEICLFIFFNFWSKIAIYLCPS